MTDQTVLLRRASHPPVSAFTVNFIFINLSEVFRYFVFVMPMMRETLPTVPNVAPMNLSVFLIWGVWDTILVLASTFLIWLMLDRFGASLRSALLAGTAVWGTIFVILWVALLNMNLATAPILAIALPLAWFEMTVAALVVRWAMRRD
jgi:hypothetical protein